MPKRTALIGFLFTLLTGSPCWAQDTEIIAHLVVRQPFGTRFLVGDVTRADLAAAIDWPLYREDLAVSDIPIYTDEEGRDIAVNTCRAWYDADRRRLKMKEPGKRLAHLDLAAQCDLLRALQDARAPSRSMVSVKNFASDVLNLPITAMPTYTEEHCRRRQRLAARGATLADLAKEPRHKREVREPEAVWIVSYTRTSNFILSAIADFDGDGWADYLITQILGYTGERLYHGVSTLRLSKTEKGFVAGPIPPGCREMFGKP